MWTNTTGAQAPERATPKSTEQKVIKHKVGLLRLAEELGNVSRACKVMGYSRDTFYRYRQAVEEGGFETLMEACELMRDRSLSLAQIGMRVGFSDANYFSRQFKRVMGRAPRDYRRGLVHLADHSAS